MIKVLFICHGNICRSPMAEFVFKDLVACRGLSHLFHIESAATSTEELGNPVYPPARRKLNSLGIDCSGKRARQMNKSDYDKFDYLIGMDTYNMRNINRICGGDPDGKVYKMLSIAGESRDMADPWYTGDFEATYRDVLKGSEALLDMLKSHGLIY